MRILLGAFLWGVALLTTSFTVEAAPEIKVAFHPSKRITVGKVCDLKIQVTWRSEEGNYLFPQPELALERLMVEESGESNEAFQRQGEDWIGKTFRFRLKAVETGKGSIRSLRLTYLNPATQTKGHFEVPAIEVQVVRDLSSLFRILAMVLASLGGLGLLGGLVVRSRPQKKENSLDRPPSLEERYLSNLNEGNARLEDTNGAGDVIAEDGRNLRSYLKEKYSLSGGVGTRNEILGQIEGRVPSEELKTLKGIFDKLDEWGYGRRERSSRACRELHHEIIRYLEGKRTI